MRFSNMTYLGRLLLIVAWATSATFAATITYTEDSDPYLMNPERGWYYSWDAEANGLDWFTNHDSPMTLARLRAIKAGKKVTLIRKYYSLWDFRNGADISSDYLETHIHNDLTVVEQAGMKLICVVIYSWSEDLPIEDASLATVKKHLAQLKPYWRDHAGQIYAWFGGIIGNDGEWRTSSNGLLNGVTTNQNAPCWQIADTLLAAIPPTCMVHLRFPGYTMFVIPCLQMPARRTIRAI